MDQRVEIRGSSRLGKEREKTLLEEQVYKVYADAEGKTPPLSDLKELLDGQTNVKIGKDLVSIEVQQLSNYTGLCVTRSLTKKIADLDSYKKQGWVFKKQLKQKKNTR